ncbi:hypothetical protein QFZ40_003200 [Arthrobacter pascens]|nr:hypothetical protein [Arthrobacter pascens]
MDYVDGTAPAFQSINRTVDGSDGQQRRLRTDGRKLHEPELRKLTVVEAKDRCVLGDTQPCSPQAFHYTQSRSVVERNDSRREAPLKRIPSPQTVVFRGPAGNDDRLKLAAHHLEPKSIPAPRGRDGRSTVDMDNIPVPQARQVFYRYGRRHDRRC